MLCTHQNHGYPQRMIGMYTRHDMEMLSASLVPCEGNPPTTDRFSPQRTGTLSFTIMISIWKWYIQLWCNLCLSQNMLTKNSRRAGDLRRYDVHMASLHWMNWSFGNMKCPLMKIIPFDLFSHSRLILLTACNNRTYFNTTRWCLLLLSPGCVILHERLR